MESPIQFPDPLKEAARRGAEFQALPPDERVRQLADVIAAGLELIRQSPNREAIDRLFQEREAEWRRIQRELFRRHGV